MNKLIIIIAICVSISVPCFAGIVYKNVHTKYLIIGNAAPPPPATSNDIGGFGGDTIGGFGGENIGGLP